MRLYMGGPRIFVTEKSTIEVEISQVFLIRLNDSCKMLMKLTTGQFITWVAGGWYIVTGLLVPSFNITLKCCFLQKARPFHKVFFPFRIKI